MATDYKNGREKHPSVHSDIRERGVKKDLYRTISVSRRDDRKNHHFAATCVIHTGQEHQGILKSDFLAIRWTRIHLPMRGHQLNWSRKIPPATEGSSPVPQLCALEPVPSNERSHHKVSSPGHQRERYPPLSATRESPDSNADPVQPK